MHQLIDAVLRTATEDLGRRTELFELGLFGFTEPKLFTNPSLKNLRTAELLSEELRSIEDGWTDVASRLDQDGLAWVTDQLSKLEQAGSWLEKIQEYLREQLSTCTD